MSDDKTTERADDGPGNFVADLVREDLAAGRVAGQVTTRFPPEPNGYLHIGHAKSIVLNFGLAAEFGGACNLRFDDTNPAAEDIEYVHSIKEDVRWLGFEWAEERYTSDYFQQLYEWAVQLIREGKAYVDSRTEEEIRSTRGDFHSPGVNSPGRDRTVDENLALFEEMRGGAAAPGAHVLRAKIDMQSKDLKLRDPLLYRVLDAKHHRTGNDWRIYPMYDWAHGQSDAIEGITHSVCTLEFVNHHGLYDWFLEAIAADPAPQQIEFARLALSYTVLSKRRLLQLVEDGLVSGWDDPRMPTIAGMRRRGYPPEVLVSFCDRIGVAKSNSIVDVALLEHTLREDLNARCPRYMGVLDPLKVVIENLDEGTAHELDAPLSPDSEVHGTRKITLRREVWVERDDFMEEPIKKWRRLAPGKEVRLRYGCLITVKDIVKNDAGEVTELRCTWDPESLGGDAPDGRKVRGTIHWVCAEGAIDAEVRLYDRLFTAENPMDFEEGGSFLDHLNPESVELRSNAKLEPALGGLDVGTRVQFERLGYFCFDRDGSAEAPVLNRTIALRDSWAKKVQQAKGGQGQKNTKNTKK